MTFAKFEVRTADLSTDFGREIAEKWFPGKVEGLPRYVRGKKKGKLKGVVSWVKITKGGWFGGYGAVKEGRCVGQLLHFDKNFEYVIEDRCEGHFSGQRVCAYYDFDQEATEAAGRKFKVFTPRNWGYQLQTYPPHPATATALMPKKSN